MRPLVTAAFLAVLSHCAAAAALGAVINVPGDFKTVQEAVEKASPNDTVVVGEGVYAENVAVTKPLTLMSQKGPDATVVRAADAARPAFSASGVKGGAVIGLTLTGSSVAGIHVSGSSNVLVKGNKAVRNESGVVLLRSSGNTVEGNTASENKVYGIYLEGSHGNTVEGNTAESNEDKGLFISNSHGNRINKNSANMNQWNGILLWSSHNNVLTGNRTLRNMYGVILSESNNNELSGNTALPNIVLILPIVLVYIGILWYQAQKYFFRLIFLRG